MLGAFAFQRLSGTAGRTPFLRAARFSMRMVNAKEPISSQP